MRLKLLSLIVILLLGQTPGWCQTESFFRVEGGQILDTRGDPILLKGLGLGGWLMPEGYMLHFPGYGSPTSIRQSIEGLIGVDATDEFFRKYRQNYVAEKDVETIASWGFNHVRLPFHYEILYDERTGTFREKGFQLFDRFLEWCQRYGLYVILDMHAAPGGQNPLNISDSHGKARLWTEPATYQPMAIEIWEEIARRYVNDTNIIGYDLLNEPVLPDGVGADVLRDFYLRLSGAVRAIDPHHILFIEGNWFATDFTNLSPPVAENTVYAFHKYWNSTSEGTIQYLLQLRDETGVPLWLGETGENSNDWFFEVVRLAERKDIGWNWWTHKKIETVTSPLSAPIKTGYRQVLDYLGGNGPRPSVEAAREALFEMADGLSIDSCDFRPDVVAALLDPEFGTSSKPYRLHTIPGKISPWEYDIGANGLAYRDVDYKNESGAPGGANIGGAFRNDGVDIQPSSDRGSELNVGWIEDGEWLNYHVDVEHAGTYEAELRVAGPEGRGRISLTLDGSVLVTGVAVPATSGWDGWRSITVSGIELPAGRRQLRIQFDRGGFNLSSIRFALEGDVPDAPQPFRSAGVYPNPAHSTVTLQLEADRSGKATVRLSDVTGRIVYAQHSTVIDGIQKISLPLPERLASGLYLIEMSVTDATTTVVHRESVVIVRP